MPAALDIGALRSELERAAVAADVEPMTAYLRHQFALLGVKTPARRACSKPFIAQLRRTPVDDAVEAAIALRREPEREFHYVASDLLRAVAARLEPAHLESVAWMVTTDSWWDTVDAIASPSVGVMAQRHTDVADAMDEWIDHDDIWLARVAILHQLRYGDATDRDRLFAYAERRADDTECFIRKATYARVEPEAVRSFVEARRSRCSTLTVNEALKHLA